MAEEKDKNKKEKTKKIKANIAKKRELERLKNLKKEEEKSVHEVSDYMAAEEDSDKEQAQGALFAAAGLEEDQIDSQSESTITQNKQLGLQVPASLPEEENTKIHKVPHESNLVRKANTPRKEKRKIRAQRKSAKLNEQVIALGNGTRKRVSKKDHQKVQNLNLKAENQQIDAEQNYNNANQIPLIPIRKQRRSGGAKICKRTAVAAGASGGFMGLLGIMSGEAVAQVVVGFIELI